jgi:aspartyl-tRNA(Asn)/glutamyl-tRNA(Gln) amidotransferase subunit B
VHQDKYQVVVGLEVHAQLLTHSKLFSNESVRFGKEPNTQAGEITLALPGTLPKVNRRAIELAIRMGLACGSAISRYQIFDRKNYFYPDLPKGYQLTQHRTPVCCGGEIPIETAAGRRSVKLHHIHLEEDAGKLMHLAGEEDTVIDFNRAGVPLIEIVTQPDLFSAEEAGALVGEIRKLVRYLDVSDGNMERGSLRCDANVSVRPASSPVLGTKVEVKNMNSIKNIVRAIQFEAQRQIRLLEEGKAVAPETRTFDAATGRTFGMRRKETLNDYRYFPEPDLCPIVVSEAWIESIARAMPPLPQACQERLMHTFGLPAYDARVLTEERELFVFFEAVAQHTKQYKAISNWLMGPVKEFLNANPGAGIPLTPHALAQLIELIEAGKVNFSMAAQRLLPELLRQPQADVLMLAGELDLLQDADNEALTAIVAAVVKEFPLKVEEFKNGKKAILQMFMGEVMKRTKGKADPQKARQILTDMLNLHP